MDCIAEICQTCVPDDCPLDFDKSSPGQCGCGEPDTDTDSDLIADCVDPDDDDDLVADGLDCAPLDDTAWSTPGEARALRLSHVGGDGGTSTLNWLAPTNPGGTVLVYDAVSTFDPTNFGGGASCIENDSADTQSTDTFSPLPGELIYMLVRAENVCDSGGVGAASNGAPRTARNCP